MGIRINTNTGNGGSSIEQDNINKVFFYRTSNTVNIDEVLRLINNGNAFGVSEIEEPKFKILYSPDDTDYFLNNIVKVYMYELQDVGKGTYGTGNTPLTATQLQQTSQISLEATDFSELEDTQIIDLGEIGTTEIQTAFNAHTFTGDENPVQDQDDGYRVVNTLVSGELVQYLFIGLGGAYGTTGTETALKKEFVPFTDLLPRKLSEFVDDIGATDAIIANTIFIDTVNGNDDTAVLQNRDKPYKTNAVAYNAVPNDGQNWEFFYLDSSGTIIMQEPIPTNRNFKLVSYSNVTFDFSNNPSFLLTGGNNLRSIESSFTIDAENSNLNFGGNYVRFSALGAININCKNITIIQASPVVALKSHSFSNITCKEMFIDYTQPIVGGWLVGFAGDLIVKNRLTIINKGSNLGTAYGFGKLNIEINEIKKQTSTTYRMTNGNTFDTFKIKKISGNGTFVLTAYMQNNNNFTVDFDNTIVDDTIDLLLNQNNQNVDTKLLFKGNLNYSGFAEIKTEATYRSTINFENFTGNLKKIGDINTAPVRIKNSTITFENDLFSANNGEILDVEFIGVNTLFSVNESETLISNVGLPSTIKIKGVLNTNTKSFGANVTGQFLTPSFKEKLNEVVVRSKYDLIDKVLDTNTTYIVDGTITLLAGEFIEVPSGGNLTLNGYGLEASKIIKDVAAESIFTSPVGGSGGMQIDSLKLSTPQSGIFNLTDATGFNALEFVKVNFENCASLGEMNGYRQGLWSNIGIFSCADGLTLTGTWLGGFRTKEVIVRNLTGTTGTLFKKGLGLDFKSRFYTDANIDIPTGWKIADFEASNFSNPKTLQLQNMIVTRAGVSNEADALYVPNINEESPKCDWAGNVGLPNSSVEFQKLRSPDNTVYKLTVDNAGVISATAV